MGELVESGHAHCRSLFRYCTRMGLSTPYQTFRQSETSLVKVHFPGFSYVVSVIYSGSRPIVNHYSCGSKIGATTVTVECGI